MELSFTEMGTSRRGSVCDGGGGAGSFVVGVLHLKMPINHAYKRCWCQQVPGVEFRGVVQPRAFRWMSSQRGERGPNREEAQGLSLQLRIGAKS